METRILIVEDSDELAELMQLYLQADRMRTVRCSRAEAALEILDAGASFDLVILDLNLPGIDGFEFLARFRQDYKVPVIIVSARETEEDMLKGLDLGADEYVCKPFSPRVLAARVRALLRRGQEFASSAGPSGAQEGLYRFGPFTLDVPAYLLKENDTRIKISSRELEVLAYLVANAGTVVSPQQVFDAVWKLAYGDLTAVAVYVRRLRQKLGEDSENPRYIQTVYGVGYRFSAELMNPGAP